MEAVGKFLAMGGYWPYVWPALGLTAATMAALVVASRKSLHRAEAELAHWENEAKRRDESQA
jgi:heme exporter protein CcmD